MTDRPARVVEILGYIGANVRRLRLSRGLTQERLAEAAGLDLRFLQRVERGQTNVGVAVVVALADALNVPPARLFRKAALPEAKPGRPRKPKQNRG
ncbi:helix-turn-helix domain-containing protein [Polyangium sorediatum]|uniref:Helix-turn-helix transcriptional regulator n=1 Tax=Polyangium sorediatum TaxID=889274 RepID=A0ABT6NN32_9BACT|nr:helix-turn-helix transcriptional regulator [Polyangium sorediatum]MDI1429617.1 helix-turn-helix transcriptional regulator [Polyangium sorediatum]